MPSRLGGFSGGRAAQDLHIAFQTSNIAGRIGVTCIVRYEKFTWKTEACTVNQLGSSALEVLLERGADSQKRHVEHVRPLLRMWGSLQRGLQLSVEPVDHPISHGVVCSGAGVFRSQQLSEGLPQM